MISDILFASLLAGAAATAGLAATALWKTLGRALRSASKWARNVVIDAIEEKLMSPNGGSSLSDISTTLNKLSSKLDKNTEAHRKTLDEITKVKLNLENHLKWHKEDA